MVVVEPTLPADDQQQAEQTLDEEREESEAAKSAEELKQEFENAGIEVVEVTEVVEVESPQASGTWGLYVPGKEVEWFPTKTEWAKAYSALGEKVALAGKATPEFRIKKLHELREANEPTLKRLEALELTVHSRALNTRIQELKAKAQATSPGK